MKLKSAFLVSLFLFVSISVAQANNLPINVIANENTTITFFFPAQIQTVIQPAVNYKFEYEPNSTMGTLVARKGAKSNLTVITKGGIIYSFLLQYDQEVDNFTYVLSPEQAIGKIDAQAAAPKGNVAENTKNIQTADMVVVDQDAGEELMAAKTIKQDFSSETVINEPMVSAKNSTDTNFSAITDDNSEKNEAGMLEDTLKENSLYTN